MSGWEHSYGLTCLGLDNMLGIKKKHTSNNCNCCGMVEEGSERMRVAQARSN